MANKSDRIHIEYDLTFETLFHCGTGIRTGLIDRTVVRDGNGYLYVPGSTFKGVLRERCEQLARFYSSEIDSPHKADAVLQEFGSGTPTMITRIFGSQLSAGKLFFDDARQSESDMRQYDDREGAGTYKSLQVDLYTQVRLARPTRTAVPGALYTSEFGTRDIVFKGTIQGWLACLPINPSLDALFAQADTAPSYSLLLLLAGMRLVDRLGGNKSTGKGQCQCKITRLQINGREYSEALWTTWLEHIDVLSGYNDAREG